MKRANLYAPYLPMATLILAAALAIPAAAQSSVRMGFSGSMVPTAINLGSNTITDEELLADSGALFDRDGNLVAPLGPFTFRGLRTDATSPQPSSACSGPRKVNISVVAGGGVFRFQDGSLLTVTIREGALCIDLAARVARLDETYQIGFGTGRFKGVSGGTLTLTATVWGVPVSSDPNRPPVLLASTGEFEGTVVGAP